MENDIFTKKPPKKYIEGFVTYIPNILDGNINLLGFIAHGYTMKEANRMLDLYAIERMKYHFKEAMEEFDPATASEEEQKECKEYEAYIAERIEQYNKEGEAS